MSTTCAALIVILITTGMTSAVSHQLTLLGGCAGALIFAGCGFVSRRAQLFPTFLFGTIAISAIVLVSSEANICEFSSTIHILSCYLALISLAVSSADLSKFSQQVIMGNNLWLTGWVLYQAHNADTLKAWAISNPSGAGNLMAAQINMTLPLVLVRIHESAGLLRLAYQGLLGLNCLSVFLVMSRNGIGSMLIVLTLYVMFNYKRLAIVIIGMIGGAAIALDSIIQIPIVHDTLVKYRFIGFVPVAPRSVIWEVSFQHIMKNPMLGVGPGKPQKLLAVLDIHHAHNNFVQVAFESGIPACIIFSIMMGLLLWMPARMVLQKREYFVYTLPVIAYFIFSWTAGPLVFPGATLLLGICVNEARVAIRRQEEQAEQDRQLILSVPTRPRSRLANAA